MTRSANDWLAQRLADSTRPGALWCADENTTGLLKPALAAAHPPHLLSNRWDIVERARTLGLNATFNDFDLAALPFRPTQIFYRLSKEKPLAHHLLNSAREHLAPGGELFVCGDKSDGAKSAIARAGELFGQRARARKDGAGYSAVLTRPDTATQTRLDDGDYPRLRAIAELDGAPLYSKPGVFGWQKIDPGSALLAEQLPALVDMTGAPNSLLDLGCGYGYLSVMARHLPLQTRLLTDNNAAALLAAEHNNRAWQLGAQILPGDCGDAITQPVDLILCNPPFHQGFDVAGELTERFLAAAARLLAPDGTAGFVVNAFIPLERKAAAHFRHCRTLADNGRFKVLALRHR